MTINYYGHHFALRRLVFEPGKPSLFHHHEYVEGVYILSREGVIANGAEKIEVGSSRVICITSEEPHSITCRGSHILELITCMGCIDGRRNCNISHKHHSSCIYPYS